MIEYGRSIPVLSAEVRRRVIGWVEAVTGLEPGQVDIAVEDVYGVPDDPEPKRFRLSRPSPR